MSKTLNSVFEIFDDVGIFYVFTSQHFKILDLLQAFDTDERLRSELRSSPIKVPLFALLASCLISGQCVATDRFNVNSNARQVAVVAAVIVREAGGEGHIGMEAVAIVIRNRATDFKKTPYQVITQRHDGFFSYTRFRGTEEAFVEMSEQSESFVYAYSLAFKIYFEPYEEKFQERARELSLIGATHFTRSTEHPYWARKELLCTRIRNHNFYALQLAPSGKTYVFPKGTK